MLGTFLFNEDRVTKWEQLFLVSRKCQCSIKQSGWLMVGIGALSHFSIIQKKTKNKLLIQVKHKLLIHLLPLIQFSVKGQWVLEAIPAQEAGYTLDRSPVHHRVNRERETTIHKIIHKDYTKTSANFPRTGLPSKFATWSDCKITQERHLRYSRPELTC